MVAFISFDAGAVPVSVIPSEQQPFVTQVAGGCGPGWHRDPYGGLPSKLACLGAPLLVPADALGPPPCLPLVNPAEIGKPRGAGFSYPAMVGPRFHPRGIHRPSARRISEFLAAINSTTSAVRSYISNTRRSQPGREICREAQRQNHESRVAAQSHPPLKVPRARVVA